VLSCCAVAQVPKDAAWHKLIHRLAAPRSCWVVELADLQQDANTLSALRVDRCYMQACAEAAAHRRSGQRLRGN
jgi:invasion protein IalB